MSRHLGTHVSNMTYYELSWLLPTETMKFGANTRTRQWATAHNSSLALAGIRFSRLLERNTLPWCRFWDISLVRVWPTTKKVRVYPFTIRVGNIDIKWMPKSILAEVVANCDCNYFIIKTTKIDKAKTKRKLNCAALTNVQHIFCLGECQWIWCAHVLLIAPFVQWLIHDADAR